MPNLCITLAQLNFLVGDIEGNAQKIITATQTARAEHHADIILFPELTLTGYPPEDLLLRADLYERINAVLPAIFAQASNIAIVIGYPIRTATGYYNRASFIHDQKITHSCDKQNLPNYRVFDEQRYFTAGPPTACIVEVKGIKIALSICEDLWFPEPVAQAAASGADIILSLNASPFSTDKTTLRESILKKRIQESHLPIVYVNCVGGQDELVFDGGSMVFNSDGEKVAQALFFAEQLLTVKIDPAHNSYHISTDSHSKALTQTKYQAPTYPALSIEEKIYQALVLGVRDYIEKNGFKQAVLGLSGGIDSALTLAIAVDAVGKERVRAIMMPSRYSADISLIDAKQQTELMDVHYQTLPIEPIFQVFLDTLSPVFKSLPPDITEENLQARCRGTLLMAIANKTKAIVLTTSNKSETAVGYATLYGDMAGGFCVLKDVLKTMVYRLAHYRNSLSLVIPERVITRAPSAELSFNQTDQDSLPPYAVLDAILELYIEQDASLKQITAAGFDEATTQRVINMVNRNEYKRRQSPPGVRITERGFGKDRRYPITSGF
jgi:NAD+ synthase (glutamine-hydrolysing)